MAKKIKSDENELTAVRKELASQKEANDKLTEELVFARKKLAHQNSEKDKRAEELGIANIELDFQNSEKEKRAAELVIANKKLAFEKEEKGNRAAELIVADRELEFQNREKERKAAQLVIANKEKIFQAGEKGKRAAELVIANKELAFQNDEKEKRAEELIVANYARSLIEASLDPLFTISNAGKITDANKASENITGVSHEKLIGSDFFDYFTEPDKARAGYEEVFDKGCIADYPLTIRDHKLTDVLFNGSVYKDEQGNVLGVVVVARDITERNKNEEHIKHLANIVEYSDDAIISKSLDGTVKSWNNGAKKMFGYSASEIIGKNISILIPPQVINEEENILVRINNNEIIDHYETMRLKKGGEQLFVSLTVSPLKDNNGKIIGVSKIARDITEQKRIEKEFTEAKVFAELATSLAEEAQSKAEDAVKAKQQFLSNMSHEIRTPMNAIIGFTKVVLKTDLTAKQKEYLTAIKMSGDALIVLINDILDLAKVDAGKMTFEQIPFKMSLSISAMLHLFETKIQEKNLELVKEYDPKIPEVLVGDPVRLHQIILNLVSNAVKFTNKGKITVGVRLVSEDEEKASIEFSVTDTGIGIAANKLEKIFENFQQASSGTSRLYGGTGLGLAIVKQLVEPQGGTVEVKSELNHGSTFSFVLSFQKTNKEAEAEVGMEELDEEYKNIKVLVVEDIALNQLLMKTLLDDFGFERDIAANGKIAIEKLEAKSYDIILMDLQMPEMNGFDATEYIRNSLNSKIPIIALTADVTTVDLAKCKAVGMNDYLAKPVDEKLLYTKILNLVKKPLLVKLKKETSERIEQIEKQKFVDLAYLTHRTKSDPVLMAEMISAYLEQTPPLINSMKQSFQDKDWGLLHSAVHKMIPSFSIMGISADFEIKAKKVQEYANTQLQADGIEDLVLELENVCRLACEELEVELNRIKNVKREK